MQEKREGKKAIAEAQNKEKDKPSYPAKRIRITVAFQKNPKKQEHNHESLYNSIETERETVYALSRGE
jgi:hypothetical protein